jgi:hypothetical protein
MTIGSVLQFIWEVLVIPFSVGFTVGVIGMEILKALEIRQIREEFRRRFG